MRIPVRSDIALKDDEDMIRFGRTEWIEDRRIRLHADARPVPGATCDLTLEIGEDQPRVTALVRVVAVEALARGQYQLDCHIERMSEGDTRRYRTFLQERSRSSLPTDPIDNSPPPAGRGHGRASVKRALKDGLGRTPADPPTPTPSAPPRASAPDPRVGIDGSIITLRWRSPRAFESDLQGSLLQGSWTLRGPLDAHGEVTLRLVTPDGQVASLDATVEPAGLGAFRLRFRLPPALKTKLRRVASLG